MIPPPSPPYLGPPAHHSGMGNKPIRRVVIHSTVSPCEPGGARSIAAYFRSASAGGSAHYVVDPEETVQAAYDSVVCWHAPPNAHSLGVEMCDIPGPVPSLPRRAWKRLRQDWRWADRNHQRMFDRTVRLTARLCVAYDIPPVFLTPRMLRAGRAGITTHANVSAAFHQSSHWDPGWWPRHLFIRRVRRYAAHIQQREN